MATPTPKALSAFVLAAGLYLLAFRHGRMSAPRPPCDCGRSSPALSEDEELLQLMPATERTMVSCLLERPGTRQALRSRLYVCLNEKGALDPSSAARLISPPSPPHPSALTAAAPADGRALGAGTAMWRKSSPPPPPPETLLQAMVRAARDAELEQLSAPHHSFSAAEAAVPPREVLAAAAGGARLVMITCAANEQFLALEPGSDWVQCVGQPGLTPLHDGLFVQERQSGTQIALRHAKTGFYLQGLPKDSKDAWVVRAAGEAVGRLELFELHSGKAGHIYLYSVAAAAYVNRRFGSVLRLHDAPGQPAGRIPAARMTPQYWTAEELRKEYAEVASRQRAMREPTRLQLARIRSFPPSSEVRIISYGLYGANTRYTIGVIRNVELAPLVYPGWKVRVYLDKTVPKPVVAALEALGAQLRWMDGSSMGGGIGGMFWRFLVASDPDVDRYIVRDSDSRLNPRERLAVEEWIGSGKRIHSIRDHPNHDRPLNGGLWGGVKGAVPDMEALVKGWSNRDKYMGDLDFLNKVVWRRPAVRNSQMAHDAFSCNKYPNSRPFPTQRPPDYQHIGQVFFGDGRIRQGDITDWILKRRTPRQCRGDPSWISG